MGREQIQEILDTLATNKLRTLLTGFSVGWGVLLLVILLSSGMGLRNGIVKNFQTTGFEDATVELEFRSLSIPYRGKPQWYYPIYTREDCERIAQAYPGEITNIAPYRRSWGTAIGYGLRRAEDGSIFGTLPAYAQLRRLDFVVSGSRFINERDELERRKVIVLSQSVAVTLFDKAEHALGKDVYIKGVAFRVVGVYRGNNGRWSRNFVPLSTAQALHLYSDGHPAYAISGMFMQCPRVGSEADVEDLERRLLRTLSGLKEFSPEDTNALDLSSAAVNLETAGKILGGINAFLWLIGLSTLAIGVVGVISIMQIAVTERRKEIGIRKALGARPRDIISMILAESVLITLVSGLGGLVVGVALMAGVDMAISSMGIGTAEVMDQTSYIFLSPLIDLPTAVAAIVVMFIGGLIAGYLPARAALRVPTVEAMRR